ncbi:MAG TPA: response regulator [Burkholderiales bacterium]|jgi:CheY-like chemotaxis protein|nr:response regulator [Burkholderiales bacterium]
MQIEPVNGHRKLRVLVVDNHRDSADALAWLLHNIGHLVCTAYDAASALRAFDAFSPDVVFQDLLHPARDAGLVIARELRRRTPSSSAVLIAMTAADHAAALRASEREAFDHVILKPVALKELNKILGKAGRRAGGAAA